MNKALQGLVLGLLLALGGCGGGGDAQVGTDGQPQTVRCVYSPEGPPSYEVPGAPGIGAVISVLPAAVDAICRAAVPPNPAQGG